MHNLNSFKSLMSLKIYVVDKKNEADIRSAIEFYVEVQKLKLGKFDKSIQNKHVHVLYHCMT